ncbi:MAG: dihydroorotate dehydrogenase electron transfer subunit [Candidatus Latescibacteria bacterium]|nr:dihydroorotate dehydrogenase electron transfer subunit [Candidatus Latescibacterota bacterium]
MTDQRASLLHNIEVAQDFYLARLQAPQLAANVQPGQFVEVQVSRGTTPYLRLPLSICGADPDRGTFDLLYEDMGPKTRALSGKEPGDQLACLGPLGHGFVAPPPGSTAVLVGGGIGIPPLLYLGRQLRSSTPVVLLAGARTEAVHLPDALLEPAAQQVERATDDGSLGHHGLITDLLTRVLDGGDQNHVVYTCGPHPMMAAVAAVCRQRQVPCQASLEEYMACGYGVCVGCVVEVEAPEGGPDSPYQRYSRVCVDGPVFDAHRVQWGM